MRGRRRALAWACGAIALLAGASPAAAAESTVGLSFLEGADATRTWDDLAGAGSRFDVCNATGQKIEQPKAFPTRFEFTASGRPASIKSVLKLTEPGEIPAGGCAPLVVESLRPGAEGAATGELVVVAAGVGAARISLTIEEAEAPLESAQVSGAGEATLKATSGGPFIEPKLTPDMLLLEKPGDDMAPLELGKGCDPGAGEEADCPPIGNLYNEEGKIVRVFVNGPSVVKSGVVQLPIRISPEEPIGKYSGNLDPSGKGEEDQLIPVTLTGTAGWWCAVAAVLLGAVLTIIVQFLRDRWRPWAAWRIRRARVEEGYLDLEREIPRHVPGHEQITASKEKVGEYVKAVKKAATDYAGTVLFIDTESDAYAKIEESLDVAEADARMLADPEGLAAALGSLKSKRDTAKEMLRTFGEPSTPDLIAAAAAPGAKGALGVGEATKRAECAEQLDAALVAWTPLARRVLELEDVAARLWVHVDSGGEPVPSGADLATLAEASAQQAALRDELFHTRDLVDIERLRTSNRIEVVHGKFVFLRSRYETTPTFEIADVLSALAAKAPSGMPKSLVANLADRRPGSEDQGSKPWGLTGEDATPAQIPEVRKQIKRVDRLVLCAGIVPAAVAALAVVFFPLDYFGTTENYLTAILAGAASQAFVTLAEDYFSIYSHNLRGAVPPKPPRLELTASSE